MLSTYRKETTLKLRHKSMLPLLTQIVAQTKYQLQMFWSGRVRQQKKCLNEKGLNTKKKMTKTTYTLNFQWIINTRLCFRNLLTILFHGDKRSKVHHKAMSHRQSFLLTIFKSERAQLPPLFSFLIVSAFIWGNCGKGVFIFISSRIRYNQGIG